MQDRVHTRPVTRDPKLSQVTEESGPEEDKTRLKQRRRTLPSELMKDDIAKLRQNHPHDLPREWTNLLNICRSKYVQL